MKRTVVASLFLLVTGMAAVAHAGLDDFLSSLNVQAKADLGAFNVKLGAQFGVPVPQVEQILSTVAAPADAFMVLQLSQMAQAKPDTVLQTYKAKKSKGWGVMAKELGIKPGSPEFHALKSGNLSFTGTPGGGASDHSKGKGKGKGRGHNK
ncbi:hypothetical protein [Geotalea toluenoxydans]|uniref:hypothetical protein n=1 Tax=Geotalea toluenoxydans TaxID=421624 RepID=UPI0006D2435C|nr:hypothetical protein [Geotalea toluenoxydans]